MSQTIPFPQRGKIDLGHPWQTFYPSQILEHPGPPQWLFDGLILRRTVLIFAGAKAVGKSLLLQQILSAAALGLPCVGRHMEQANSFGYFCEDSQEWLERRQFDINASLGVEMPDYEQRYGWQSRAGQDCLLAEAEYGKIKMTGEWGHLWRAVADVGAQLVGIDTASAVFGGNESSRAQVAPFVRECVRKAIEINGAVIINLNTARDDPQGYAGSGAWHYAARSGLNMHRPEDDPDSDQRILKGLGANYHRRSVDRLIWRDGVFVPDEEKPTPTKPASAIDRAELDYRLLAGLKRVLANGGRVPADVFAAGSLPRRARISADLERMPLNALYEAQERLVSRGQIIRVAVRGACCLRGAEGPKYPDEKEWRT